MIPKKIKVAVIHPALMDYRLKLFEMISNEYDATFIFTKQGLGQESVKENHLQIPIIWKHKILRTKWYFFGKDIGMIFKLSKEILLGGYDAILFSTNWYVCWPLSKLTRKKSIYWTEFWYWKNTSMLRKLLNACTYYIAKNSDSIVATGSKAYLSHMELGVKEEKIFTYPQCSANYNTDVNDLRFELGLVDKKIILYLGRIVSFKGLPYLIESLKNVNKHVDNAFLIVIGTGPLEGYCKKLAADLGLHNIMFTGFLDDESMKLRYYKTCDLFVLPSVIIEGTYEPWGLVVNEAMGFAKPIITTDAVGSEYDMVQNEFNGYVVPNKDSEALSKAILKIITDDAIIRKMGLNSRERYEHINVHKKMFEKFTEAISYALRS
ncbi:glycosyltransferase family 4 protein [uncultured Methanolobus sp.]|uniref:glycosyltransferase family 4 protein n=1 Tax=uncultured Methanolobus sp. TaxID=218300 RepID=UPI0029C73FCB|nr:glycosyltransferase family 4 protein [uncultured Methanolobus sp.]